MKFFALVSVLLMSLTAFAGPEEHKEAQTCYRLKPLAAGIEMPTNLPYEVCLEDLSIEAESESVTAYSYFQAGLFEELRLRSFKNNGASGYSFEVSSEFYENRVNGDFESLRLAILGQTDLAGVADLKKLKVSIVHVEERDYGHSGEVVQTFEYELY